MTTSVDVQGMQLAQQDFQQALDQMNSVYSAMTEEQDNLTANWSGMAASAFGQALGAWLDDLWQIRQELVVMTESLSAHTGIYSDANETSQQVVTAFQHGLEGLEALPAEPMVAMRRVEGKLLLPEKGIAARRMAVEGEVLPELPEAPRELPLEPLLPETLHLRSVAGVPAGVLPSETLSRLEPALPVVPALPVTLRMTEVLNKPVEPTLRVQPESS